jgi:hypothetical protein
MTCAFLHFYSGQEIFPYLKKKKTLIEIINVFYIIYILSSLMKPMIAGFTQRSD